MMNSTPPVHQPVQQHAPLRIGFVMLHTSPLDVPGTKDAGGMNVVVRAQAESLAQSGHTVRVFTRRADPSIEARVRLSSGLEVVHLDAGPARILAKAEHEPVMVAFSEQLAIELEREPVELLHAEHWFSGIAALPVARALRIPLVQSFHSIAVAENSSAPGERPESPGRLAGERRLASEADLLIAVSEAERETIAVDLGGDPDQIRVVPLGVDTELFHPRNPNGSVPLASEVLVVGRLHPLKAFDLALEALAEIPSDERPRLRIVGAPPPDGDSYERALHAQAAQLGLLDTTVFEGALDRTELARRIRQATVLLVPSHTETFGLVALEASASGIPVIARNVGGLREAVLAGETGLLVTGGQPSDWATAIRELLSDPERMTQMGRAAREHALQRSWKASSDALVAAYRGTLTR